MKRKNAILSGVAAAAIAAGGATLGLTTTPSGAAGVQSGAQTVTSDITFSLAGEVLAVPPANAAPAVTAQAALTTALNAPPDTAIPDGMHVYLGLYTLPIGPAATCQQPGEDCSADTIVGDTVYSDYQVLAYGFEYSECGNGSLDATCVAWEFADANTGADLGGIRPRSIPSPSASPSGG